MAHPNYPFPDDGSEGLFSEAEFSQYCWADRWRDGFHWYEDELCKQKDVRHAMLNGAVPREPLTIYEPSK